MEGVGAGPMCGARSSDAPGVSKLPGVAPMGVRSPARRAAMLACARRSAAGSRDRSACGPQPQAAPVSPGVNVQRHRVSTLLPAQASFFSSRKGSAWRF